jgi:vesicle-associated membrane protein 7
MDTVKPSNIETLTKEVDETKHLLMKNCEKVIERGNTLNNIDEKAADLNASSVTFKKTSTQLKNKIWWQEKSCMFIGVGVTIIIIVIIIASATHKK